jgi:hypothetical protein
MVAEQSHERKQDPWFVFLEAVRIAVLISIVLSEIVRYKYFTTVEQSSVFHLEHKSSSP